MKPPLAALWLALLPLLLQAQDDPLAASECHAARAELEQALQATQNARPQPGDRLSRARQKAKSACLGPGDGKRERSGAPEPPQAVPSAITRTGPPEPRPAQPGPGPLSISRPTVLIACDASGCWDSEGRRLNSAGPTLMGPHGPCGGTGTVINCP